MKLEILIFHLIFTTGLLLRDKISNIISVHNKKSITLIKDLNTIKEIHYKYIKKINDYIFIKKLKENLYHHYLYYFEYIENELKKFDNELIIILGIEKNTTVSTTIVRNIKMLTECYTNFQQFIFKMRSMYLPFIDQVDMKIIQQVNELNRTVLILFEYRTKAKKIINLFEETVNDLKKNINNLFVELDKKIVPELTRIFQDIDTIEKNYYYGTFLYIDFHELFNPYYNKKRINDLIESVSKLKTTIGVQYLYYFSSFKKYINSQDNIKSYFIYNLLFLSIEKRNVYLNDLQTF